MPNYFFTDSDGVRQGPLTEQRLQTLVERGIIKPTTPLETEGGHKGLAGQIPGLFTAAPMPSAQTAKAVSITPPPAPKQVFCTNCGNLVSERAVACMSCGARPTGYKEFCRQCGVALNSKQIICIKCGSGLTDAPNCSGMVESISPQAKKLNIYFMVWWICAAASLAIGLIGAITTHLGVGIATDGRNADSILTLGMAFTMISFPISLGGTVFCCILLYLLWKRVPTDIARTSPGKAVGFLFIPIFSFYWFFVAYKGLGEDMNRTLRQRGIQYRINESLGLVYCILSILCYSPLVVPAGLAMSYIAILIGIATLSVAVPFFYAVKGGAIALLEQEGA